MEGHARDISGWSRVLPGVWMVAVLGACGIEDGPVAAHRDDATPVQADYFVSEHGVRVGIQVGFDQAREVTGARLLWDGGSDEIALYPVDGSDPDVAPDTVVLNRGRHVSLEGSIVAACPEAPGPPVFEVVSRSGGAEHTDRFVPDDPGDFEKAFAEWCDRSVSMNVRGSSVTPEGDYELRIEFTNPGPSPVVIVSERVDQGGSTWQPNEVVVPQGSVGQMTVLGHGAPECAAVPPWELGRILADGAIITPPEDEAWC